MAFVPACWRRDPYLAEPVGVLAPRRHGAQASGRGRGGAESGGSVVVSDASQQCGDICDLGGVFAVRGNQVTAQFAQGHEGFVVVADAGQQQADLAADIECAFVPITGCR